MRTASVASTAVPCLAEAELAVCWVQCCHARRLQLDENVPERELCKMAGNTMAVPVLQIMLSTALAQIAP